jgi:hypothetical protein
MNFFGSRLSIRSKKKVSFDPTFHVGSGMKKNFGSGSGIRDEKCSDPNLDQGSGIKYPGSATLVGNTG